MTLFRDPLSDKLTQPDPEFTRKARATHPGMAHLAGEGPKGMTCRHCIFWQHFAFNYHSKNGKYGGLIRPASCAKFKTLTGKVGDPVPDDALACKYFELNNNPPERYSK